MKRLCTVLATAAALLTSQSALAESWHFQTLSLSNNPGWTPSALTLVSQSATETVLKLDSLAALSARYAALDDNATPSYENNEVSHWMMADTEQYRVAVHDGYRVTGVTLDVTVKGELRPGRPNGTASNTFYMDFGFSPDNGPADGFTENLGEVHDLNGTTSLGKSINSGALGNQFVLTATAYEWTTALAARHYDYRNWMYYFDEESYSNIWADEIKVTFHTAAISAVPEPGTYLMLGTGLALLGLARRRRSAN